MAERLRGAGSVLPVVTDVRHARAVHDLAATAIDAFGAVHVVFNNAGVSPITPLVDMTPDDWQWVIEVNLLGVAYGIATFAPLLVAQGEGHIVNTASEMGLVTSAGFGPYAATKHAVVAMSETLSFELERTGVGVSCLCPNAVRTDIFRSERNRPTLSGDGSAGASRAAPLQEALDAVGIPPSDVADRVYEAIESDTFWVFTHPVTLELASHRFEAITRRHAPVAAYPT